MNQLNQKNYYRIMLGRKSIFAKECFEGKWIGAGWLNSSSLENELVENWRDFNKKFVPIYLSTYDLHFNIILTIIYFLPDPMNFCL